MRISLSLTIFNKNISWLSQEQAFPAVHSRAEGLQEISILPKPGIVFKYLTVKKERFISDSLKAFRE